MTRARALRIAVALAAATVIVITLPRCKPIGRLAVKVLDEEPTAPSGALSAAFTGVDEGRTKVDVQLVPVLEGLAQLTDLQPIPGNPGRYAVLTKTGAAYTSDLAGNRKPFFTVDVVNVSEQGLLGLAFHPDFATNRRFFTNTTPAGVAPEVTRITEWVADDEGTREIGVILEVEQPYQNHNAGQLAFGPDGMLYIGLGDGGLRDDPFGNAQDGSTLLGSMLRIDIDSVPEGSSYGIPADNPFRDTPRVRDEAFAIGLRNPWRYSFDPEGRLVVADVGQNTWEEISIVPAGANLGWNAREGAHCFPPKVTDCATDGLTDPVYAYGRDEGISITGGVVVTGTAIPKLEGLYLFGDFGSGRIWAIDLDAPSDVLALGKWPILPVAFALDPDGNPLVVDFGGRVLAIRPTP